MTRRFLGVRWWLRAAFAVVAAVSTAIVVAQYSSRSESALLVNARDAAAQSTAVAAALLANKPVNPQTVRAAARRTRLTLAVYDPRGRLVAGKPPTGKEPEVFVVRRPFRGGTFVA